MKRYQLVVASLALVMLFSLFVTQMSGQVDRPLEERVKALETKITELETRLAAVEVKIAAGLVAAKTLPKPTEDEIRNAVATCLKGRVPPLWAGSLLGGTNGVVDSMQIIQIGNYNEIGRYWPIRARVKGSCDSHQMMGTKKVTFDRVGDFKLFQDDYGKWQAEIEE